MTDLEFSDEVLVSRTPDAVYALVSDITRMGEWSPTCKACWWDDDAGPAEGAWFTGRNDDGKRTWETRSQVVAAEPARAFAWEVNSGWVRWGFTLDDADDGATRLTQHWHFLPKGIAGFRERYGDDADAQIAARSEAAKSGIPVTLAAIKATAEAS